MNKALNLFKKKLKREYEIKVFAIEGLNDFNDQEVTLKWKRGNKDGNKGEFDVVRVEKGKIREITHSCYTSNSK